MSNETVRILVVDDEPRYIWGMRSILEAEGYGVIAAPDGTSALQAVALETPDLVLLDIRMPDMSGFDVCQQVRKFSTVPIIFLTALAEEGDKVRGLNLGADDYLTKPFGARELLARVSAVLRRIAYATLPTQDGVVRTGHLEINLLSQKVTAQGHEIDLTSTEFRVLAKLAERLDRVCTSEHLIEHVWGEAATNDSHLLRQIIYRLRQKLEEKPSEPTHIVSRPGVGYCLVRRD